MVKDNQDQLSDSNKAIDSGLKSNSKASSNQRKRIIYVRPFVGEIRTGDLQLINDELNTDLAENEILCEAIFIGIDAGLKTQVLHYPDGITMIGAQIARVTASRNEHFPVGAHIYGKFGWQTHTVTNPSEGSSSSAGLTPYVLPGDFSMETLALGCLGVTGNAALIGLQDILRPQPGETLLVTAAAGGVGNLVGQLAKELFGCKVIGVCGSERRAKWLTDEVRGFDAALSYRDPDFEQNLRRLTPDGVDAFFDSVGGSLHGSVVQRMNENGRIAVNGLLASVNDAQPNPSQCSFDPNRYFVAQQLQMRGFSVWQHTDKWTERVRQLNELLRSDRIRNYETIVEGFEKCPDALVALLRGEYNGRVVVKV